VNWVTAVVVVVEVVAAVLVVVAAAVVVVDVGADVLSLQAAPLAATRRRVPKSRICFI